MEKILVYQYYTFIFGREVSARGPRAATLQAIERLEGVHRSGRYLH